jgi:hypothetical protein
MHNYLKLSQCNMGLRMFSSERCGRTEVHWKMGKLYGILLYLTEIYSYMNRCTMTLKHLVPTLDTAFSHKRYWSWVPHTVTTRHLAMSQPPLATQHVVRWEVVSQRASCWGHYWHGLIQNWHGHDWPLHVTTKLRTPKANYTMQFVCVHMLYSIHPHMNTFK